MYAVKVNGEFLGYVDSPVFIKVSAAGSYVQVGKAEADGVCVKLVREPDGDLVDTVFSLPGHVLAGAEAEADLERVSEALLMNDVSAVKDREEQLRADVDFLAVMTGIDL